MSQTPLLLIGASGLATEVAECARRLGREVVGCLDDDPYLAGHVLPGGVKVLGTTDSLQAFEALTDAESSALLVCVGQGSLRRRVVERLRGDGVGAERFATLIDERTVVPPGTVIGAGTVLLAGVVITAPITIGAHVVVMPHVTLTHDDVVEDFVTLAAGVRLGGGVRVGPTAYLGMSSSVRQGLTVGEGATLGMGAVLLQDQPAGQTWVGVPARPL
jgi:sugar O-acyltransferase (sialic acid O-acetyltransferase NeuD family)